jgi:hypothetical protein
MTAKKQQTTALQAAQQCGINEGVQLQAFMKGVAYARKHGDWRSVKDELTENREVLADVAFDTGYGICHDYCIAHFDQIIGLWFTREKQPINVVNWMPLPELPKAEEQ